MIWKNASLSTKRFLCTTTSTRLISELNVLSAELVLLIIVVKTLRLREAQEDC